MKRNVIVGFCIVGLAFLAGFALDVHAAAKKVGSIDMLKGDVSIAPKTDDDIEPAENDFINIPATLN